MHKVSIGWGCLIVSGLAAPVVYAEPLVSPSSSSVGVVCDVLVVGGGLAGVAAAYEALQTDRQVCLTELTDWVGGQISSQGTSALDETVLQRSQSLFPRGYLEFRKALLRQIKQPRPGNCWVSDVCFLPKQGNDLLMGMLRQAERKGKGKLHWFPNTVVKALQMNPQGNQIVQVQAIQHQAQPNAPALNTTHLSQLWDDFYSPADSAALKKTTLTFSPPPAGQWMVLDATETGELLALADLPYRVGIDPRTYQEPSSSSPTPYPYCTQAITYTFAMEATEQPEPATPPSFYAQYEPFYSYDAERYAKTPALVFTYRRIFSTAVQSPSSEVRPGDISMQNWGGGNDYGPGTSSDNLLYTRQQLLDQGQLAPNGWKGGLRASSLKGAEELALGYFYWLVAGTTDSVLGDKAKQPWPNLRFLKGFNSPMGTAHGLSKFPYIREGRRLIGRFGYAYPEGFTIRETDISSKNYREPYYQQTLSDRQYRDLITSMAGLKAIDVILGQIPLDAVKLRSRARLFPDSVGIGHYPIDFHPCRTDSPVEKPGNPERSGERQGAGVTYPYQIPLRSMIPPRIDNLIITGKSIATSHISAASYRVHSFEWSAGAAAGTTAVFALERQIFPFQLVDNVPRSNPLLETLQQRLEAQQNPIRFPGVSLE